ncbi:MAG: polyprenol monophosphomannose synthase, partial [bacterium]|nr:polyprenol monophosphomannose synthase [bacterium]
MDQPAADPFPHMRVTIVIPTYNERENLRPLIERIATVFRNTFTGNVGAGFTPAHAGGYKTLPYEVDILIVDDHSPDGTGDLAEELAREYSSSPSRSPSQREGEKLSIRILRRPRKEGLGAAYVAGFERALADGADVIVQMDADGSHDPGEIPGMLSLLPSLSLRGRSRSNLTPHTNETDEIASSPPAPRNDTIGDVDLVIGSRRVPGGRVVGWGWHRRLMSWAAQALARWLLDIRTRDVTSGFRVWRAEALAILLASPPPQLPLPEGVGEKRETIFASGYAFQEETLFRAEAAGLRIVEHPITFRDRERGRSKLGLRDILGFFRTCTRLWWSDRERRFAVWLGVSLIILTSLPYLYGWLRTPPDHVYTGVHALASGDMAVYGSYIEQIRDGRWTFVDLFTSEWPQRSFLNIFWLPVGLIARIFRLPTVLAFHVPRLLLIVPFILFLSRFVAAFLRKPIAGFPIRVVRRTALLFLAFSSGLGALIAEGITSILAGRWRSGYDFWPMDLWVAESNTFLTLFQSPHFIASLWLLLFIILAALHAAETKRWRWSIGGGVAALALFQFHPFHVPTIALVLVFWTIVESATARRIRWDLAAHAAIVGIVSAPSVLYHLWLVATDFVTSARANQNLAFTTDWWLVLMSYGFLVPLAISGVWVIIRASNHGARSLPPSHPPSRPPSHKATEGHGKSTEGRGEATDGRGAVAQDDTNARAAHRLLFVWLVATIILIYSPLTWQRRLTEGLHVVIVLVAIIGLFPLLAWLHVRAPMWIRRYAWGVTTATIVAIPLLGISTIVNLIRDFALYTLQFPRSIPQHSFYYPTAAVDAMRWIRTNANPGDVTFAVGLDGNFLPMY